MRRRLLMLLILVLCLPGAGVHGASWESLLGEARDLRSSDPEAALAMLEAVLPASVPASTDTEQIQPLAELFRLRGELLRGTGEYGRAAEDAEQFSALAALSGDLSLSARALFLRGSIEAERGQLSQALDHFHSARQLLESADLPAELARIINAIGVTHNFGGDAERALDYFERAVEEARLAGDDYLTVTFLGNLAGAVAETQGPLAALPRQREVLELGQQLGDANVQALAEANLCDLLVRAEQLLEANDWCSRAVETLDRRGELRWRVGIRMAMGDLRRAQDQPAEAVRWYEEGLALAGSATPAVRDDLLERLADLHQELDQPAQALGFLRSLLALREEQRRDERQALIEELEIRYQLQRSAAELDLLRLGGELQTTQIRLRNMLVLAMGIVLMLALLATAGALRSSRVQAGLRRDLAARNQELEKAVSRISELARRDPLTGLLNRRALEEMAGQEMARHKRDSTPLSVVIADIDQFKPINDRHGHSVGDEVLEAVAERLRQSFRESDLIARWGGEEFLCLLPNTTTAAAAAAIERFRADLRSRPIQTRVGPLTISLTFGLTEVGEKLHEAIRRADKAMYQGKAGGRDRLVTLAP